MTEKRRLAYERLKESGHYKRAGYTGGMKTRRNMIADPDYYSKIGESGGKALYAKYGRDHMSKIGQISAGKAKEANEH